MLLGKRPRHLIRRTTSMSGITVDLSNVDPQDQPSDAQHNPVRTEALATNNHDQNWNGLGMSSSSSSSGGAYDERFLGTMMVSPGNILSRSSSSNNNNSNDSGEYLETASFLKTCGLCRRRLVPGRDIYMYRGDTAFCSQECREKKIKHDERKEKAAAASKRDGHDASNRY